MSGLSEHDRSWLTRCRYLAGVDEAGRGALAGPVVAGAIMLDARFWSSPCFLQHGERFNDSKQLTAIARDELYAALICAAAEGWLNFGSGLATVAEIERFNILGATRLAMQRALQAALPETHRESLANSSGPLFAQAEADTQAVSLLVDGRPLRPFPYPHHALVKGDSRSMVIAMASIIAKVTRDRHMCELHEAHPNYLFTSNKGYGSAAHFKLLREFGPSTCHRWSFLRKSKDSVSSHANDLSILRPVELFAGQC